jgi:DNA helicase-2/ATP-dependent DNA helicase PcrA
LSTCHQAKGKEWKHVFAVGLTEGILPHNKANHVEEKRIWFVMASRAAEKLFVSCYKEPSMFLNAYRDKIVEYQPEITNGVLVR